MSTTFLPPFILLYKKQSHYVNCSVKINFKLRETVLFYNGIAQMCLRKSMFYGKIKRIPQIYYLVWLINCNAENR